MSSHLENVLPWNEPREAAHRMAQTHLQDKTYANRSRGEPICSRIFAPGLFLYHRLNTFDPHRVT